jgi:Holliday junction resolvase RusA-like endonuclease
MIQLQLPVNPVPASRPRVTRAGFSYYAEPYRSFKDDIKEMFAEKYDGELIARPCGVTIAIFCPQPKKTKLPHPLPDVDNFAKAVLDGMNGTVLADDKWVSKLLVTKAWAQPGDPGRIHVYID